VVLLTAAVAAWVGAAPACLVAYGSVTALSLLGTAVGDRLHVRSLSRCASPAFLRGPPAVCLAPWALVTTA